MEPRSTVLDLENAVETLGRIIDELPGSRFEGKTGWIAVSVQDQPALPDVRRRMHRRIGDIIINLDDLVSAGPRLLLTVDDHPFDASSPMTTVAWWLRDIERVIWGPASERAGFYDIETTIDFGLEGCLRTIQHNRTLHRVIAQLDLRSNYLFGSYFTDLTTLSEEQIYGEVNLPDDLRLHPEIARQYFADLAEQIKLAT